MMLKTEEASLNTLRVASKDWPGLVYYQGVTSRTTLSTAEKATQTNNNTKNKKFNKTIVLRPKIDTSKNGVEHEDCEKVDSEFEISKTKDTDSNKVDIGLQKETKCGIRKPRKLCSRPVPTCSTKDESLHSDDVVKHRRSSYPDKTLLPLPNVSWNEMTRLDEGSPGPAPCLPFSNLWSSNQRISRPHTAGPRVIVPLKHTCPVGLSKEDFIRGTRLGGQNTLHDDINSREFENGVNNTVISTSRVCSEKRITNREESPRKLPKPLRHKDIDANLANLELTITSIQPESLLQASNVSENSNSDSDTQGKDENTQKPSNNSSAFINSYNFNTMEGIRKSYRRAQSAPPTHHRQDRIQCGNNVSSENSTNQKPFSNLYWRAKSAYHKRLEATSEEELEENTREDHKNAYHTKHTLLRPLLRVDSDIKHSAGCPYKCQGCFKACLVSDDYVQKAIAKAVNESENVSELRKERCKPHRVMAKSDIVKEALGRSQPLFHQVYGGSKVRGRIKIRPWPNYGWMDLKMKKEEGNEPENCKQKDDDSGEGKSTASSSSSATGDK